MASGSKGPCLIVPMGSLDEKQVCIYSLVCSTEMNRSKHSKMMKRHLEFAKGWHRWCGSHYESPLIPTQEDSECMFFGMEVSHVALSDASGSFFRYC